MGLYLGSSNKLKLNLNNTKHNVKVLFPNMLPIGYTRLDCIESSGTQYIDTGFIPNSNSRMVLDFALTRMGGGTNQIIGGRTHASKNVFAFGANADNIWRYGYGTAYYNAGACDLNRHSVDVNKNVCSIDGVVCYTAPEKSFTGEYSIYIGSVHAPTGPYPGYVRVYSCQIYDNGMLVRNYVPCINPSGEIGMYDKVHHQFYGNAGTGTFIYDYKSVEYIESDGNQYIDTGFVPTANSKMLLDFYPAKLQSTCYAGCRKSSSLGMFTINSGSKSTKQYGAMGQSGNIYLGDHAVGRHTVSIENGLFIYDGVETTVDITDIDTTQSVYLFACNTDGPTLQSTCRIYGCKIWESGVLVRNLVPCVTASGAVGMYDKVNGQFYGNSGDGSFAHA